MNQFNLKTKPAFKIVILFIIGIIAGRYGEHPLNSVFISSIVLTLFSLLLLTVKKWHGLKAVFLGITTIFLGCLHYQNTIQTLPLNHVSNFFSSHEAVLISGIITNYPVATDSTMCFHMEAEIMKMDDSTYVVTSGQILVNCRAPIPKIKKGYELLLQGKLRQPAGERNPGEFDYRKYLTAQGIYGIVYVNESSQIQVLNSGRRLGLVDRFITYIRENFEHSIDTGFSAQNRAVLKGLILGERGEISPDVKDAFSNIGVTHLLAVSGLHVGYVVLSFALLFMILRIPYRMATILTMFCLALYASVVGFNPPVVRATIVVELYLFGKIIQRQSNPLNLLSTSSLVILMINPLDLFEASFQLSYAAVLSIFYLYRTLNRQVMKSPIGQKLASVKITNYIVQLFLVSLAASCGTLPLTIFYFEKFPLIAVFVNIIVIPMVGFIIAIGFLFLLVAPLWGFAAGLLSMIINVLLTVLVYFISYTGELSFSHVPMYGMQSIHILVIYIFIILLFNLHKNISQKLLVMYVLLGMNFYLWKGVIDSDRWLEVVHLDVGQGDAALIRFPNDKVLLIDGGMADEDFNAGERHIVPYLRRTGVDTIHAIVLTHADNDHLGGIPYIMTHLPVKKVIDNSKTADTEFFKMYRSCIDSFAITHSHVKAGDRIVGFDECGIFVFHPQHVDKYTDHNNASVVLKIVYGDISFLFTGDIEHTVESELARFGDLLKSTVLKIPHHGSKTSSSDQFLEMVAPEYAVISVGAYNSFNHPSPLVLERLDSLGIETIRTDVNGAVIFRTDGKRLERIR